MTYDWLLLIFGVVPLLVLWLCFRRIVWQAKGALASIVGLILLVSVPWELTAVGNLWYYSPRIILGPRIFRLPVEELAFFVIDGLLVGTVALVLDARFGARG